MRINTKINLLTFDGKLIIIKLKLSNVIKLKSKDLKQLT